MQCNLRPKLKEILMALKDFVKRKGLLSRKQIKLVHKWLDEDWEARDQDKLMVELVARLVATCEAPAPLSVRKRIESMVVGLLGGPRGDPDEHHMLAAAHCVLLLRELGFSYDDKETLDHLSNVSPSSTSLCGNIYDFDFMEAAKKDTVL
jgi:hypothetical protein